jgi:hypothetical protein
LQNRLRILVFEPDLLFSSKIESTATKLGVATTVVTDLLRLLSMLKENRPAGLIVNLDALDARIDDLTDPVHEKGCTAVGYYSHVNAEVAEEARRIGFEVILSRGALAARIVETFRKIIQEQGV